MINFILFAYKNYRLDSNLIAQVHFESFFAQVDTDLMLHRSKKSLGETGFFPPKNTRKWLTGKICDNVIPARNSPMARGAMFPGNEPAHIRSGVRHS
ncbi:hypothetical protein [Pseudoxanthomonas wuyuanensis]